MIDPVLTQRLVALENATRIRVARAALRIRLQAPGEEQRLVAVAIVNDPPELIAGMPVGLFLRSNRGIGETKARKLAVAADIRNLRTALRDLTARQRRALAHQLAVANRYDGSTVRGTSRAA